jgi:hypothetical protein
MVRQIPSQYRCKATSRPCLRTEFRRYMPPLGLGLVDELPVADVAVVLVVVVVVLVVALVLVVAVEDVIENFGHNKVGQ